MLHKASHMAWPMINKQYYTKNPFIYIYIYICIYIYIYIYMSYYNVQINLKHTQIKPHTKDKPESSNKGDHVSTHRAGTDQGLHV